MSNILNGKIIAQNIKETIKADVNQIIVEKKRVPGLAVILVGEDPASEIYVQHKKTACEQVGFYSEVHSYPSATPQRTLLAHIEKLNQSDQIDGILVQLPLPKHITESIVLEAVQPEKDVDGFHPFNIGKLAQRKPLLRPCTPKGIITLLEHTKIKIMGKNAVIVGASNIVGRPMALELLNHGATVTVCHRKTENLEHHIRHAEILVVAAGKPNLIPGSWVKSGAIIIDVGINRLENGQLCGDVNFTEAAPKASWITPVPGGVGPMTVATLLSNTLEAYTKRNG
tara:strand:+ start:479 stop:1330 length:852 start_codon:yes stop_codon:yes gene_type:complete